MLASILSFLISLIYQRLNRGRENLHLMMQSLIILSVTIAAAMMIVGNELARAFGLVGAVSVIRFRTAVQNYRDMAFVFIAIVIGMACGLQFYLLSIIVGGFTGGLLFILGISGYGHHGVIYKNYIMSITLTNNNIKRQDIEKVISSLPDSWYFIGMKTNNKKSSFEYQIQVKNQAVIDTLISTLTKKYQENNVVISIFLAKK
ncbi:MAG: DUF4956 domain-containing protein [Spirochaetales bacterium]|nr:DUF4956 domain-containing protein [Spirochaetales bacterium]